MNVIVDTKTRFNSFWFIQL